MRRFDASNFVKSKRNFRYLLNDKLLSNIYPKIVSLLKRYLFLFFQDLLSGGVGDYDDMDDFM